MIVTLPLKVGVTRKISLLKALLQAAFRVLNSLNFEFELVQFCL